MATMQEQQKYKPSQAWIRLLRKLERRIRDHLPDPVNDVLGLDLILGCLLGLGMGIWATKVKSIEGTESTDLIALAGAAVGLLAITLAVMALLMSFLSGRTEKLIQDTGGTTAFFRPFKITARVSALAILASVAGAIDASTVGKAGSGITTTPGPSWLAATFFGVSIWFFVWATIGVVQLVGIFTDIGALHYRVKRDPPNEDSPKAPDPKVVELAQLLEVLRDHGIDDPDVDLFLAILRNDVNGVRLALGRGANANAQDRDVLERHTDTLAAEAPELWLRYMRGGGALS